MQALLVIIAFAAVAAENDTVRVVSGVYFREITNVVVYESDIPWYFEIPLPKLYNPIPTSSCGASEYICDLANFSYEAYKRLQDELVDDYPFMEQLHPTINHVKRFLFDFFGKLYHTLIFMNYL